MAELNFPCSGCGLCCRGAGKAVAIAKELIGKGNADPYVKEVADFPYGFTESGACEMLTSENKCSVYDSRPLICSINKTWEKFHKDSGVMSLEQYHRATIHLCNSMIITADLDDKYLIDPENKHYE